MTSEANGPIGGRGVPRELAALACVLFGVREAEKLAAAAPVRQWLREPAEIGVADLARALAVASDALADVAGRVEDAVLQASGGAAAEAWGEARSRFEAASEQLVERADKLDPENAFS